jgi:hypothetical protein
VKECFIEKGVMRTQIVNGGEILIPNNVTHIYDWEHDNREFETIIESNSIHYIRNSAYLNCPGSKISMQQLKEQRLTPAKRFVLETIKGVKSGRVNQDASVSWYSKDDKWLFGQDFEGCRLWIDAFHIWSVLKKEYHLSEIEIQQLLTRLLHKYTNNGQLKILMSQWI